MKGLLKGWKDKLQTGRKVFINPTPDKGTCPYYIKTSQSPMLKQTIHGQKIGREVLLKRRSRLQAQEQIFNITSF